MYMKNFVLLILAGLLVFGCTGPQAPSGGQPGPGLPGTQPPAAACSPSYSFSEMQDGTLGGNANLIATVTCAAGKRMAVKLDGVEVISQTPATNATQPVQFDFGTPKDGTLKLTVESDGETVFSRDWNVRPLGSDDTKGLENDAVSFKEWRAMAVDVDSIITPARVRLFLKRIDFRTQPGTEIVVEIRDDDNGNPGDVVGSVKRPINATTLSDNWLNFDFAEKPTLQPGRYWVVLRIDQTESISVVSDSINIHYVAIDKQSPGNDYTRQMMLDVDPKTGQASETQWVPLSYDREYTIVLTSGN
ncbi:MAG: choice-of-anchor R domain-containing protein [Candidatus Micrarchaeota archaeon]